MLVILPTPNFPHESPGRAFFLAWCLRKLSFGLRFKVAQTRLLYAKHRKILEAKNASEQASN
ncbi:hypothetical protein [Paraburkholderia sp. BCC1884]|uniref:hypothetical protein n=1 Tax=Paraburkholderia sp. BCC1884 TaxID=2562668 RepID=UPI00164238C1|nr:hypothetical protein [Paraburkholderia sp. BCC1884]